MPVLQKQVKKLTFGATSAGDMFKRIIDKIFGELLNVFGIIDGILVVGYDNAGRDHNNTFERVLLICREVNPKLNKDKCYSRCSSVQFFGEIISRHCMRLGPRKLKD